MIEDIPENISEDVVHIAAFEMIFLIPAVRSAGTVGPPESAARPAGSRACTAVACTGSCGLVKCRMAELIVQFSLLFISQDVIRLGHFFEFLLCLRIARICIRVIFLGELPVCFLDLGFIRISADDQPLIIRSLS